MDDWKANDPLYAAVSVAEVLDAMERNGYEKAYDVFIIIDVDGFKKACAIGQAALNLELDALSLFDALRFETDDYIYDWGEEIAKVNDKGEFTDYEDISVPEIAKAFRIEMKDFLSKILYVHKDIK